MTDTGTPATPQPGETEQPSTGEEWIINHIRKLESAVDEILFALKAGGYAHQHTFAGSLPAGPLLCACGAVMGNAGVTFAGRGAADGGDQA